MGFLAEVWALFKTWVKNLLGFYGRAPPATWALKKIYVFNEGPEPGVVREFDPARFPLDVWETHVEDATGWTQFRLEIRYAVKGHKYRLVLRQGDPVIFPPYQDFWPARRGPSGIVSASLIRRRDQKAVDVTDRVRKYSGPHADWHEGLSSELRLHDMFPFDDHDDNAERFECLRAWDVRTGLRQWDYAPNPYIL